MEEECNPAHAIYATSSVYFPLCPYCWDYVEYPNLYSPPPLDVLKWVGRTVNDHAGNEAYFVVRIPNETFQPIEARGYITQYGIQYAPEGASISCQNDGYDAENNQLLLCYDPYFNGSGGYEMFTRVVKNGQTMDFFSRLTIR